MDYLQILERNNGTVVWTERIKLQAGHQGNDVIDKKTDSGKNFVFHYFGDKNNEPIWKTCDWCRIISVENANDPVLYDEFGIPTNAEEYEIDGIDANWDAANDMWLAQISLMEPIERFNWVVAETLSYTNQISKTVTDINGQTYTYTKDPYNCLTALERFLKATPANCDNYDIGYNPFNNRSWFNRIKILEKDYLQNIPFDDDTFNEMTLYEVLLDKFDSLVGRTPVAYFDINPATDLPYNSERDEYILRFERQNGVGKPELDYDGFINDGNKTLLIRMSKTRENFATGVITNAENIATNHAITYPSDNLWIPPEVFDDVRDTTKAPYNAAGSDNWGLRFNFNIKKVNKLSQLQIRGSEAYNNEGVRVRASIGRIITDKTPLTFERKQYLSRGTKDNDEVTEYDPTSDSSLSWYDEGNNELHIKSYYNNNLPAGDDVTAMFRAEIEPLADGKLVVGDDEFVVPINQTASQIDNNKFYRFSKQYLDGMNKADLIISKRYDRYADFKDLIGTRINRGNRHYMITNVSFINKMDQYEVFFQLNENHFRKNNNYQAAQEIRDSVIIGINEAKQRKSAIKQVINIGLAPQSQQGYQFAINKLFFLSALIPGQIDQKYYPQLARVRTRSDVILPVGELFEDTFYTAPIKFVYGNQINFIIKFFDNAEAGKRKIAYRVVRESLTTDIRDIDRQATVIYTDPLGEFKTCDITLSNVSTQDLGDFPYQQNNMPEYDRTIGIYQRMQYFPSYGTQADPSFEENKSVEVNRSYDLKDMFDILNKNVIIEGNSIDGITCSGLCQYSRLLRPTDSITEGDSPYEQKLVLMLYSERKQEFDSIEEYRVETRDISTFEYSIDNIEYDFLPVDIMNYKSIIIYAKYDTTTPIYNKLLIFNEINDTIKQQIFDGKLQIYFN